MILSAGPPNSVSFTDDTSLDARKTAGSKVSIHCQVLRERPLDWYYGLLRRTPSKPGELKSSDVTSTFLSLSNSEKRRIIHTLKLARVNITDPRPYLADFDGILGRIIPGVNAEEFFVRLERAQKEVAQRIQRESRRFVARRILWDSPSERLVVRHRALTSFPKISPWIGRESREHPVEADFDFGMFEDGKSRLNVNSVSVFVSKSGSVFYPALDELDEATKTLQWPATAWDFWGAYRALGESHAFDDGNRKAVAWIDSQRSHVLSRTDPYFRFLLGSAMKPLEVVDSMDSFFVQAADLAAGIVRVIWEQRTLVHVVRIFEYVTYNGKRIGESDAARITAGLIRNHPQ